MPMVEKWHMPDWLYRMLPYLYAAVGLMVMFAFEHMAGTFSGVVLILAGVTVLGMRARYRQHLPEASAEVESMPGQEPGRREDGTERLLWRPEYECGHPVIDAQHRGLFYRGNAILETLADGHDRLDLDVQLKELVGHAEKHFCDEETILLRARRPLGKSHRASHQALLVHARELVARHGTGENVDGELREFVTRELVMEHIVAADLPDFARNG